MSTLVLSLFFLCTASANPHDRVSECLSASPRVDWEYIDHLGLTSTSIPQVRGVKENLMICDALAYDDAVAKQETMLAKKEKGGICYHRAVHIWTKAMWREYTIRIVVQTLDYWLETHNEKLKDIVREVEKDMW
ncbi:hypothetical protein A2239_03680 [Candidatus Uhrbacteria bacterium RIFOXYA2_FULL_40_9]|nr:MAG: hypothetical protein A2239_03680 [Candidatus Uhrbacteria bacterium RIFOXYA2_FULL_40_9]OGL96929.1 MAG: hypothetical protein A2332_03305 [Candidatus Uhrbacteria bacterium RIFOXYB2_FULL_41_18]HBK35127.1 hypothetical protein [Candidatus Uhrbacteria bacterium]HCB56055.1 hypothetical protein [Candidatus Uhrbacteria bacterium]